MARLTLPDQSTIDAPTSLQAWQLADIQRATLPELERARKLADSPAAWAGFVDPGHFWSNQAPIGAGYNFWVETPWGPEYA